MGRKIRLVLADPPGLSFVSGLVFVQWAGAMRDKPAVGADDDIDRGL
jgi:hypothetical protein